MDKAVTVGDLAAWCRRQPQGLLIAIWHGGFSRPVDPEAIGLVPRMGKPDPAYEVNIASVTREQLDWYSEQGQSEDSNEPDAGQPAPAKRGRKPKTV